MLCYSRLRLCGYCLCSGPVHWWVVGSIPGQAEWVKDSVLPRLWHRSQLWLRFDPCLWNFHMLWVQPRGKKKKKFGCISPWQYITTWSLAFCVWRVVFCSCNDTVCLWSARIWACKLLFCVSSCFSWVFSACFSACSVAFLIKKTHI